MPKLDRRTLAKLPPADAHSVLDFQEIDAESLIDRGITPKDRKAGRRLLKRIEKLRDEI